MQVGCVRSVLLQLKWLSVFESRAGWYVFSEEQPLSTGNRAQYSTSTRSPTAQPLPHTSQIQSLGRQSASAGSRLYSTQDAHRTYTPPALKEQWQPSLSLQEIAQLRSQAQEQARLKELKWLRVGKKKITQEFLRQCADFLDLHEILQVRVARSSGLKVSDVSMLLDLYLDAVCICRQGNTLIFYRQKGLPRPSITRPVDFDNPLEQVVEQLRAMQEEMVAENIQTRRKRVPTVAACSIPSASQDASQAQ